MPKGIRSLIFLSFFFSPLAHGSASSCVSDQAKKSNHLRQKIQKLENAKTPAQIEKLRSAQIQLADSEMIKMDCQYRLQNMAAVYEMLYAAEKTPGAESCALISKGLNVLKNPPNMLNLPFDGMDAKYKKELETLALKNQCPPTNEKAIVATETAKTPR